MMARYSDDIAPAAASVSFAATGNIAAENVQSAIAELDAEKLASGGQALTVTDQGSQSAGTFTPEPSDGFLQRAVNDGAHSLAAPAGTGIYRLVYTNGASAGAITPSGFDAVTGESAALAHTTENSVIEIIVVNDGVKKVATVTLLTDASA